MHELSITFKALYFWGLGVVPYDGLVVLDTLKMHNLLQAEQSALVKSILCNEGMNLSYQFRNWNNLARSSI